MNFPRGMHKDATQRKTQMLSGRAWGKIMYLQSIEYSIAIGNYGDFVIGMTGVSKNLMECLRSSLPKAHANAN